MNDAVTKRWLQLGYSDIASVSGKGDEVIVEFANGDTVRVPLANLGVAPGSLLRAELLPDGAPGFRAVPQDGDPIDISWEQVRLATDPGFAHEMRRQDAAEARRLGRRLKALREDRGLSQRALAKYVGMSAPQLSKVESGTFDLRVSTVQTLLRAMGATLADIADPNAPEISQRELIKRAKGAGVPADTLDRLAARTPHGAMLAVLLRAFDWTREALLAGIPTNQSPPVVVRYKTSRSRNPESPLVNLAYRISMIVRLEAEHRPYGGISSDARVIRREILAKYGEVTLHTLLEWMSSSGIGVVPLHGRGAFSAAAWLVDGAPIVVLKEMREFMTFWLFDLAHELGHIAHGHLEAGGIMDVEAPNVGSGVDNDEQVASAFALQLLLPNHTALLREVRAEARGSYLLFKGAVARVAERAGVSAGLLGMVAAYELQEIGQYKDRWGSATNLARDDGPGRRVAQPALWARLAPDRLSDLDSILMAALVGRPGE